MAAMNSNASRGAPEDERLLAQLIFAHFVSLWKVLRAWVFRGTLCIVGGVISMALLIRYQAESNLLSVFLAYLPVWVVALPFLPTLAAGICLTCWRSIALSVASAMFIVLWLGGYSFGFLHRNHQLISSDALKLMTYNRGQGSEKVLVGFADEKQPDIAVFQDADRRLSRLASLPVFSQHLHSFQNGEYVVLSRWPLLENGPLLLQWPVGKSKIWNAGTRSVVDWNGRRVVLYNIHFPTPRDLLYWYAQRGTFLYGVLGLIPQSQFHLRHQLYLTYWSARVDLSAQVASLARAEQYPVVLLGDFNFPPLGRSYCLFKNAFQDAHEAVGKGFGFTFPSNFKSIGRLLAPWVRIDHVFASAQWEILSCDTPSGRVSQHLPVVAVMRLERVKRN